MNSNATNSTGEYSSPEFRKALREAEDNRSKGDGAVGVDERRDPPAIDARGVPCSEAEAFRSDMAAMDRLDSMERVAEQAYAERFRNGELERARPLAGWTLGQWLCYQSGGPPAGLSAEGLEVVSRSLSFLDAAGRRMHGMYALAGDAAVTAALVRKCFRLGFTKQRASDARTVCTRWNAMSRVFVSRVPSGFVAFPVGVDPGLTRAGGEALEALVGLLFVERGFSAASRFLDRIEFYLSYDFN